MNLDNGTYAVVDSDYDTALSIYKYPEEGEEQYMSEDMIFSDEVQNLDKEHMKIYTQLLKALQEKIF